MRRELKTALALSIKAFLTFIFYGLIVSKKEPGRILITTTHTIEIEGQDKPACVAESLALFMI